MKRPNGENMETIPAARRTGRVRRGGLPPLPPYAYLGALALLVMVPLCLRLPWVGDQGLHAAVVERLRADLLHPGNPLVDEDTPSPYYSPWMLLLGAVARVTGWGTPTVLSLAAVAACLLLVTGVYRFVRTLTDHRWAPVLALPLVVLLWGWDLFAWSGWTEFTSLALTIAYPSTFALGMCLHLWAWLQQEAGRGWRLLPCLALGVLGAAVLLVHQFTGMVGMLGAASVVACAPATRTLRGLRGLAAAVSALVVVLTLWPYYDFWALASVSNLEDIHRSLYRDLLPRYGLALLGLPALAARARRRRLLDPLVLLFLGSAAVFTAGGLLEHWSWGRIWPGVMLAAQLALAVEVTGMAAGWLRRTAAGAVAAALAVGAWSQAGVVAYVFPGDKGLVKSASVRKIPTWGDYSWITPYVHTGDVILTKDYYALRMAPAYGPYTVAPAYPDFFLPDEKQRWNDTFGFFSGDTTPARGRAILARYHVRWIIKSAAEGSVPRDPMYTLVATGPRHELLIRVGPATRG